MRCDMRVDLKHIRENPGGVLPFEYEMDLSGIEKSAPNPVKVSGRIVNRAGVLLLDMTIGTDLSLVCDRCAMPINRDKSVRYEAVIAESVEDEEIDDIIVCGEDYLELDGFAADAFILGLDSKNLCREDCKGLCQICGNDLNESECGCVTDDIDPRLEKLKQLLK
jgi:uncharacterized protein